MEGGGASRQPFWSPKAGPFSAGGRPSGIIRHSSHRRTTPPGNVVCIGTLLEPRWPPPPSCPPRVDRTLYSHLDKVSGKLSLMSVIVGLAVCGKFVNERCQGHIFSHLSLRKKVSLAPLVMLALDKKAGPYIRQQQLAFFFTFTGEVLVPNCVATNHEYTQAMLIEPTHREVESANSALKEGNNCCTQPNRRSQPFRKTSIIVFGSKILKSFHITNITLILLAGSTTRFKKGGQDSVGSSQIAIIEGVGRSLSLLVVRYKKLPSIFIRPANEVEEGDVPFFLSDREIWQPGLGWSLPTSLRLLWDVFTTPRKVGKVGTCPTEGVTPQNCQMTTPPLEGGVSKCPVHFQ